MRKKMWIKIGLVVAVFLIIIQFGIGYYLYDLAIERNVEDFLVGNADLEVSAEAYETFTKGDWKDWVRSQDFDEWEMNAFDDITLKGYYLPAKTPSNKMVIFAHGYLGRGTDMGLYGEHYVEELGYHLLFHDMRGHGKSGGDYIGFGWHDRIDLVDWIDRVIEELGEDVEIVLHGVSMGAATVLMASGEELPSNVKAIVADSPYSNVYDLFAYQLERIFRLPEFPFIPATDMVTGIKAGYNFKEASALLQVEKATTPILYIHGGSDTFVPTAMTKELVDHTNSKTDLLIVDGASHGEAIVLDREGYIKTLNKFLREHVN